MSQLSPIHACPRHGSWATFIWLSHVRAKSELPMLQNWDWSAKGDNPDRKSLVFQDSWGLGMGLTTPPRKIKLFRNRIKDAGWM